MSFLSIAFLWGLPLLAVPVAIHLLSRRRQEVVKWGAMQFLMDSSIRRRKIWRIDDLILMLLRTLAVLGLVLALARPLWHGTGLGKGTGRDVIFVWDVSLSMGRELDGKQTSFDHLLAKSNELMEQLTPGDTVRGMITIGRGKWLSTEPLPATADEKHRLIEKLQQVGVTQSSADWCACLGTALRVAPPRTAKARLVIAINDGQQQGWSQQDPSAIQHVAKLVEESSIPVAIELYNAVGAAAEAHNFAVDKLTTPRPLLGTGETFLAEAEIRNHGHTAIPQIAVEWLLDDVSIGKSSVGPIAAGQSRQVVLKHSTLQPGIRRLKCRIDLQDNLASDNERVLILETVDRVPLLLVDDSTENDPLKSDKGYFLAAVGQDPDGGTPSSSSSVFRVTTVTPQEFAAQSLSDYRAIVFANTPEINEQAVARLSEFVRDGGGLWMALGDRTQTVDFNRKFYRLGGGLTPWPVEDPVGDLIRREEFVTIHPPDRDHPATALLSDTQRLDVDRVKVFQRFPFAVSPATTKVPVLLKTGTGEALAIEGFLGHGRVIVQSVPMGIRWSNLPLTQAYVPMVHEWLWYLVQPTAITRNLLPGEPLQVSLPQNEHVREIQLNRPGAAPLMMTTTQKKGEHVVALTRETLIPGHYEAIVRIEGKVDETLPYEVARMADESNLDQWPPESATKWTSITGFRLDPTTLLAMPSGTSKFRPGEPIWSTLLALVVLAFLAELWLARYMAGKRFGTSADPHGSTSTRQRLFGRILGIRGNP